MKRKHALLFLLTFSTLLQCDVKVEEKKTVVEKKKEPQLKEIKKPTTPLINNENLVEWLTNYGKRNPETKALIHTTKGKIKIKLYKDTPLHRANFVLLSKCGYFDGCLFSRVVKGFMAQCGGSYDEKQRKIQDSIGVYTIPEEMTHHHFHKKGAVAAARSYTNNPNKRSEPDEFYFVEGIRFSGLSLDKYAEDNNYTYSPNQRKYYLNDKGAAHLDGEHTVFGEIITGLSVISKITSEKTDSQDWPNVDIYVKQVELLD